MANNENVQENRWELSLYEQNREPQQVITDDTEIIVTPRSLHSEVMCPICLDILNHTMTTKECLHRFCRGCINTALRNSNRECPTCRKKIVSGRSLRRDVNFDELIAAIFGNREDYLAQHTELMERTVSNANSENSLRSSGRTNNCSSGEARGNGEWFYNIVQYFSKRLFLNHKINVGNEESDHSETEAQEVQEIELTIVPLPSESSVSFKKISLFVIIYCFYFSFPRIVCACVLTRLPPLSILLDIWRCVMIPRIMGLKLMDLQPQPPSQTAPKVSHLLLRSLFIFRRVMASTNHCHQR